MKRGRKSKGIETVVISFRVPLSDKVEIKKILKEVLWKMKNKHQLRTGKS